MTQSQVINSVQHSVGGATFTAETIQYQYSHMTEPRTYVSLEVAGDTKLEALNEVRKVLEALNENPEFEIEGYDNETLVAIFEEVAAEVAEELEVPFIYIRNGRQREYTPASMWEPSGGCEWEESASEYDYGWDL